MVNTIYKGSMMHGNKNDLLGENTLDYKKQGGIMQPNDQLNFETQVKIQLDPKSS